MTNLIASAADNLDALTAALEGQDSAGDVSARVRAEVDAALVDRSHPIHRFRGRVVFRIKDNSLLVLVTDNGRGMGSVSDYESEAERQTKEGSRFVWMGSAEKAGGRGSIAARIRGASGPFYREPSVQAETGKKRGYLLWYSLPLIDS